jgi:hypothetical protein
MARCGDKYGQKTLLCDYFISSQAEAVKDLFAQVLLKCYGLGLIGGELFAIDGCKPPSNAAKEWSGTLEELGKKKKDLEALMGKITAQNVQLDKQAGDEKDFSGPPFPMCTIGVSGQASGADKEKA